MIRIITGSAKNKKIKTPDIENFRAVQEKAKGALFSILGDRIINSVCLDIFAGSGNLGLEALSRGASECDFVDKHKSAYKVILENINNLGFENNSEVILKDSVKYVANTDKKYDFIFVDPFYFDTSHIFLLQNLAEILNKNGVVAFFHGDNFNIESALSNTRFSILDQRKFGKSYFTLLG